MSFFPKVIINIILGSFDNLVPEAQSHLNTKYGNSPSHSQLVKDSYEHPLNKLSAEMSKIAVKDVGQKFRNGYDGQKLANYVANTYFVYPEKSVIFDLIIKNWIRNCPKSTLEKLKFGTIYEHAHYEAQQINKEAVKKIKKIMDYFKKATQ